MPEFLAAELSRLAIPGYVRVWQDMLFRLVEKVRRPDSLTGRLRFDNAIRSSAIASPAGPPWMEMPVCTSLLLVVWLFWVLLLAVPMSRFDMFCNFIVISPIWITEQDLFLAIHKSQ